MQDRTLASSDFRFSRTIRQLCSDMAFASSDARFRSETVRSVDPFRSVSDQVTSS